jgi:hypothetical protein
VKEADIGVVDALVGYLERLALLERHVTAVTLPRGWSDDARWTRHVILRPGRRGSWHRSVEGGRATGGGGEGGVRPGRVERLDDASTSFSSSSSARTTSSWRGFWRIWQW